MHSTHPYIPQSQTGQLDNASYLGSASHWGHLALAVSLCLINTVVTPAICFSAFELAPLLHNGGTYAPMGGFPGHPLQYWKMTRKRSSPSA